MATVPCRELQQFAGRKVTKCPLPYCPAPNLFVAKKGTRRHCIGCWRKFTAGVAQLNGNARQKRPSKRLLRLYSPLPSATGPPPVLLYPKLKVIYPKLKVRSSSSGPIADSTRPPPASNAEENNHWPAVTVPSTSVESEYDDDVMSTARWTGASAPDEQSCADSLDETGNSSWESARASSPDLLAIDFPEVHFRADDYLQNFYNDMTHDESSENTSVGSVPDEHIADWRSTPELRGQLSCR